MELKSLIKDNEVTFDSYRAGIFYYNVKSVEFIDDNRQGYNVTTKYQFPVPIEDIGNATMLKSDKAITFMRWIRKAKEDGTLIKIK